MMMPVRMLELEAGVADRLFHRNVIPRRTFGQEPHRAAIDHLGGVECGRTVHLRTEAELGGLLRTRNARLRLVEARKHFLGVVTDGRDNAHPRDDNPPHVRLALPLCCRVMIPFKMAPCPA